MSNSPHLPGPVFPPGMVFPGFAPFGASQQIEGLDGAPPGDLPEFHFHPHQAQVPLPYLNHILGPVALGLRATQDEIRQLRNEAAEHRQQSAQFQAEIGRLTAAVTQANNSGHEADDEAEGRSSGARSAGSKRNGRGRLMKAQLHAMQAVLRRVITQGCGVDTFQELTGTGLSDAELQLVDDDWDEPWKPDFTKAWSHDRNKIWVNKILHTVLNDEQAKNLATTGGFPATCFNKAFIGQNILSTTWASCRGGAKTHDDPLGAGKRRQGHKTRGNRQGRRNRLCRRRRAVAAGATNKKNPQPFKYAGKSVPPEMFTLEVTSDVISDSEYEIEGIYPRVSVENHKAARHQFECEGIKPFYRHLMWDEVLTSMEPYLSPDKGAKLTARFYAGNNRGDRSTVTHDVNDIPTGLYRCQISRFWYDQLPEWKKNTIRPSPPGWEVDEEVDIVASEQT